MRIYELPIAFSTGSFGVRNAQRNVGLLHLFGLDLQHKKVCHFLRADMIMIE